MKTPLMMFIFIALFAFSGAVAQAHRSPVLQNQQDLSDWLPQHLYDDPASAHQCELLHNNGPSGMLPSFFETGSEEVCIVPMPAPNQELPPNLAIETKRHSFT